MAFTDEQRKEIKELIREVIKEELKLVIWREGIVNCPRYEVKLLLNDEEFTCDTLPDNS